MADAPPTIQLTGPLILGYQFNWGLYGVLAIQLYTYHQARFRDTRLIKFIVYGLFITETLQLVMATHDSFHTLALGWGNSVDLVTVWFTWFDLPFLTGFTSATIQCFYAWRIYVLSKSYVLAITIAAIALVQGSAAMAEGIQIYISQNVPGTQVDTFKTTAVWLGGTALCDIIICCAMFYFLSISRTGFRATDSILNRLIRITMETGMTTAIIAIIELTLFLTFEHNFYHVVPSFILSKMYSNSFLVLLNGRKSSQRSSPSDTSNSYPGLSTSRETDRTGAMKIGLPHRTSTDDIAMVSLSETERPEKHHRQLPHDRVPCDV
ncbi:hypothetical protein DEU56DRAFT_824814 [Suillus clintonianus]|uniref:uncharacterized protein n=1 Tax=Suillus clintonianus TaxID=1904413 RepID=UPI001B879D8A|nr:uncharacterized protein DEU56DRAFT_824814 [Suillus clintonianus]KAG2125490.1 hypothetical protein DEU56DRAFT_824814 [Suillus clintonianus]